MKPQEGSPNYLWALLNARVTWITGKPKRHRVITLSCGISFCSVSCGMSYHESETSLANELLNKYEGE